MSSRSARSRSPVASAPTTKREYLDALGISSINPDDARVRYENYAIRKNRKAFSEYLATLKGNIGNLMKLAVKIGSSQSKSLTWVDENDESHVIDAAYLKAVTGEIMADIDRIHNIAYASRPNFEMSGLPRKDASATRNMRVVLPAIVEYINASTKEFSGKYGLSSKPFTVKSSFVESRSLQNFISTVADQVVDDGKMFKVSKALLDLLRQDTIGTQQQREAQSPDDFSKILGDMNIRVEPKTKDRKIIYTRTRDATNAVTGLDILAERGYTGIRVGTELPVSIASVIVSFYSLSTKEDPNPYTEIDLQKIISDVRRSAAYTDVLAERRAAKEAQMATRVKGGRKGAKKAASKSRSPSPKRSPSRSPRGQCVVTETTEVFNDGVFSSSSSSSSGFQASPRRRSRM